jgi:hypothetical protein
MQFIPESYEVFPEGIYAATIDGAQEKTSKKSTIGPDMIELRLIVTDGRGSSNIVYDYITKRNVKEFAIALGESVQDGQPVDIDPDDLPARSLQVCLIQEEYMGKIKNRVKQYLPPMVKPNVNEFNEADTIPF